jgi:hypothetical protein
MKSLNIDTESRKDLEENLENLVLESNNTNITLGDLRNFYNGSLTSFSSSGKNKFLSHYFFFVSGDYFLNFPHMPPRLFFIPFFKEKYGFTDNHFVDIDPKRLELNLNTESREIYESILSSSRIRLNDLLEKTGFIINNTMRFSNENATDYRLIESGKKVLDLAGQSYEPSEKETLCGMCEDAGDLIRKLLYSYCLPNSLRYVDQSIRIHPVFHDITCVFDQNSANWAIINSKSPRLKFNLAARADLKRLGVDKE